MEQSVKYFQNLCHSLRDTTTKGMHMDISTSEKILIVDDDDIQRSILEKFFSGLGYEVAAEIDGEQGLMKAKEWLPDIILLDVYLPGANGIDVLDDIRADKKLEYSVVVMMSADTSEDTTVLGLIKQADDFIYKPVRTAELALKLRKLMDRKRHREALDQLNQKLTAEKEILSHYFSDDVVAKIVASDDKSKLSGENITASILFFDIRNFTNISENLKPNLVADLLNLIFTDVMDLILSHDGSVNKLIGDAILATFGAPFNTDQDAKNTVKCAIAITDTIKFFNQVKPWYLESDLKVGIGITTGEVFAGNIGSYRRMEYTVIGDVVNTASRLQTLTKKVDTDILMDGATYAEVKDIIKARRVKVKSIRGKEQDVKIYTVDGIIGDSDGEGDDDDMTFF